jgi:hypothetical protein
LIVPPGHHSSAGDGVNPSESSAADGIPDALYCAFEEQFRGSREEVARRLAVYLPVLEQAGVREAESPVLDLGCGRGDWLELLGQHDYAARGVDLNEEFVVHGQQRGMDVVHADAVEYLSSQPEGSCAAVTSFHVVEHLAPGRLVDLLAQTHRVLRPGGIFILETPNPENHVVGACTFYLDPSHVAPLPPELLQFLTEQAGFATTWVARVNSDTMGIPLEYVPRDAPHSLQMNAAIHLLNQARYTAPDYAIIAQKDGGMVSIAGSPELERICGPGPMDITSFRRLEAEAKAHEAEAKGQEAEARAQEAEAKGQEAEARAHEAEAKGQEAEARAQEAEAKGQEAEARAQEAEAKGQEAEARAQEAEAQFAAILRGASWRITRPLRWAKRAALRFARPWGSGRRARRWAAVREVSRSAIPTGPAGDTVPSDLEHLPVSAREVFDDLERALERRGR